MSDEKRIARFGDNRIGLTDKDVKALLLLALKSGKVVLVYAALKKIPYDKTAKIMSHPDFTKKEYHKLLNFYDGLAKKCEVVLGESIPTFDDLV